MPSGGFLKHFGFILPISIAMTDIANPPRDSLPVSGRCELCLRDRSVCYRRGDGKLVCKLDIIDTVRVQAKKWSASRRTPVYGHGVEEVSGAPWDRQAWWDKQFP